MAERRDEPKVNSEPEQDIDLYEVVLSPEEADGYFRGVREALDLAKERPYSNIVGKVRGRLAQDHYTELIRSIGILFPLSRQECVLRGEASEATLENVRLINMEVMTFLASFKNTGVRIISTDKIIPTMTAMLEGKKLPH